MTRPGSATAEASEASGAPQAPKLPKARLALRIAGFVAGVGFVAAAIWIATRERGQFVAALAALRDPPPLAVAGLLAAIVATTALTSALFVLLFRRFARIPFLEMFGLVAAASFANYLPLKPGFAGRVAYHRLRHGVRATDTLRTMLEAIGLSGVASASILGAILLLRVLGIPGGLALLAPALVAGCGLLSPFRTLAVGLLIRQAEFALLAGRYWIAFRLVGSPVDLEAAAVVASVGALATFVPFIAGGLGVREWLTGIVTPLVSPETFAAGVLAELVQRVAELAVFIPMGLGSAGLLARHVRSRAPRDPA